MRAPEPEFLRPESIASAVAALADPDALALAGGTSIVMLVKNRLIEPTALVCLSRVPGLAAVHEGPGGELRLGSMTTLQTLSASPLVRAAAPALATAADRVGNPRIRAVATLGGAVVHGDPRQDVPPVLLALGASVTVVGDGNSRTIPADELFLGFMETAVEENELVTDIAIPSVPGRRCHYVRFTPASHDDYPTVCVAVSLVVADDRSVHSVRVALGGVAERPVLVAEADAILAGRRPGPPEFHRLGEAASAASSPVSDHRGSAAYKKAMAGVWASRAVRECLT